MSYIDTLVTVFKLETRDFEQAMKKADKSLDEAVKDMTLAEKAAKHLGDRFVDLAKDVAGTLAAFASVHHIFSEFNQAAQQAIGMKMLSDTANISMKQISAWGHAAVEAGGNAEDFQSSVKSLNDGIQDLSITGDSSLAPAMRYLGLNFLDASRKARPMNDILLELSGKFEKMDKQRALDVGKRLGLDQGTIFLLMKGRQSVEELLKKKEALGALDEKNAQTAIKFNVIMDETSTVMEHLYMAIGSAVLPVVNTLLKGFIAVVEFFVQHKPFLYALLGTLAILLWNLVAPALAAAASFLVMAAPIIALVALFALVSTGIALLIDDLWNFLEGNDSVLGAVVDKWQAFKDWLAGIWNSISSAIGDFWESLMPPEWLINAFGAIGNLMGKAADFVMTADAAATNPQITNNSNIGATSKTVNNNIKASATVNTAAVDATGVSKAVGSTMGEQLRSAVANSDDGVYA